MGRNVLRAADSRVARTIVFRQTGSTTGGLAEQPATGTFNRMSASSYGAETPASRRGVGYGTAGVVAGQRALKTPQRGQLRCDPPWFDLRHNGRSLVEGRVADGCRGRAGAVRRRGAHQ